MVDPLHLPEGLVRNQVTDGTCGEYAEALARLEVLRTVVTHVVLDEVAVVVRIGGAECQTLLAIGQCEDRAAGGQVVEAALVVHGHGAYAVPLVEDALVVELRLELVGHGRPCCCRCNRGTRRLRAWERASRDPSRRRRRFTA